MAEYALNKGVLRPLEFKGLRARYIFVALGGFLVAFVVYMILSFVDSTVAVVTGVLVGAVGIGLAFYLNSRFGATGLQQLMASKGCVKALYQRRRMYAVVRRDS